MPPNTCHVYVAADENKEKSLITHDRWRMCILKLTILQLHLNLDCKQDLLDSALLSDSYISALSFLEVTHH